MPCENTRSWVSCCQTFPRMVGGESNVRSERLKHGGGNSSDPVFTGWMRIVRLLHYVRVHTCSFYQSMQQLMHQTQKK